MYTSFTCSYSISVIKETLSSNLYANKRTNLWTSNSDGPVSKSL